MVRNKNRYIVTIALMSCFLVACGNDKESMVTPEIEVVEVIDDADEKEESEVIENTESFQEAALEDGVDTLTISGDYDNTNTEIIENADNKEAENADSVTDNSIRLIMVGDILLHTKVSESAHLQDGTYDYNPIFANTSDVIQSADLALVNEEVIIGGEELGVSGYPAFNAPYEVGDALVENGFDVILHATNHAVDKGRKGLHNCMNFWQENYPEIEVLGIHDSEEDQNTIFYYEQNGMKIAILNYTYGTNGISLPDDMPWSVDLFREDKVVSDIKEAEENADFTIVCPHWGTEYNLGISAEQKKWAKIFVENGADLVIGTHPHVIEPVEWYVDDESGNSALIYYSIGNYVNWTSGTGPGTANRMVGGLADVTLKDEDGKVVIDEYKIHGLVSHLENGIGNVTTYFLKDYSDELASKNEIIKQDGSFSYEYCVNLCNNVWTEWE